MDRVFLDANVLFSAAWREAAELHRLWNLPGAELLTSRYALEEARRNLPEGPRRERLEACMERVALIPEAYDRPLPAGIDLPAKDRPILLAALAARATHLLTGDRRDFGALFGCTIEKLQVLPPADFLRTR